MKRTKIFILSISCALLGCRSVNHSQRSAAPTEADADAASDSTNLLANGITIDPFRELIVTQDEVLSDPNLSGPGGPFYFTTLMHQMVPLASTDLEFSQFLLSWIDSWANSTALNGESFTARPPARYAMCKWINASGGVNCILPAAGLRLDLAPFKLIAIVNRMDLRKQSCDSAGQGRFVFALLDEPSNKPWLAKPIKGTLILEYDLPTTGADAAKTSVYDWASLWHKLGTTKCQPKNCSAYKSQLVALTQKFTARGTDPSKPEGNSLSRVRTNEFAFGLQWELREFALVEERNFTALRQVPITGTPQAALNRNQGLAQFILSHRNETLMGTLDFPINMLAAVAPGDLQDRWFIGPNSKNISITDEPLRFAFAKSTCNGCHVTEPKKISSIDQGFHLSPFLQGQAKISPYLHTELFGKRRSIFRAILVNKTCALESPTITESISHSAGLTSELDYSIEGFRH